MHNEREAWLYCRHINQMSEKCRTARLPPSAASSRAKRPSTRAVSDGDRPGSAAAFPKRWGARGPCRPPVLAFAPPEARRSPRMKGSLAGEGRAHSLSCINFCNCAISRADRTSGSAGSSLSGRGGKDRRWPCVARALSPRGCIRAPGGADPVRSVRRRDTGSSTSVRRLGEDSVDDSGVVTRDRLSRQSSDASLRSAYNTD